MADISNQTRTRFHDLDALRGFAMLLGLVLHASMSFVALPVNVSATRDIYTNSSVLPYLLDAIHGFRMPLFFLVSGLFTALLWQKRGLKGLLKHRALRIGLPLLLGLFTIVPAVFILNIGYSRNIWFAAAKGDSDYVDAYVATGGKLDTLLRAEGIPGNGATPLHLATARGQVGIVESLLQAGANPNVPAQELIDGNPSLATALHWAAFSSEKECLELLLAAGADPNAQDASGQTPLDFASLAENQAGEELLIAAGGQRGSELTFAPPNHEAEAFHEDTARRDYLGAWIGSSSQAVQIWALLTFFPVFVHLWFLWYLLWLVLGFAIFVAGANLIGWRASPRWSGHWPSVLLWALPATFVCQLFMVQGFGPDTAAGLVPWPPTLFYYGVFFAAGAAMYMNGLSNQALGRKPLVSLFAAFAALIPGLYAFEMRDESFWIYQGIGSLFAVLYVWFMISALYGIFQKLCAHESKPIRYLSDASYWIYLVHLPIVNFLQFQVSDWTVPSVAKLILVIATTFLISLLSYQWFVRYSFIGALLNGRKTRRGSLVEVPSEQAELVTT